MANNRSKSYKVGRDAGTGRFIPVKVAQQRKNLALSKPLNGSMQ